MKTELTCLLLFKHDSQRKHTSLNSNPFHLYFTIFHEWIKSPNTHWRCRFLCITKPSWPQTAFALHLSADVCVRAKKPGHDKDTSVLHDNTTCIWWAAVCHRLYSLLHTTQNTLISTYMHFTRHWFSTAVLSKAACIAFITFTACSLV